ncbi:hypothetical protein LB565_27760 [Mesorhizobium sp. CA14]|uniref:hypothetical protein n=1 Tax=Mesorhizobium sp. CA14 TaxID=2876642 RepID=UPI001CCC2F08|nr:hypothetical protein [Mesorhizobium sp. CA14]MBZ9851788.1 hypothetical protein [Mesorhizobium sp. CA14]
MSDIDGYMDTRSPHQTRRSVKDVAERLRSMLRYLHRTGRVATDLSPHVIAPLLYAHEGVPSILTPDQVAAVLHASGEDKTPAGLRDPRHPSIACDLRPEIGRNLQSSDRGYRLAGGIDPHQEHQDAGMLIPAIDGAGG